MSKVSCWERVENQDIMELGKEIAAAMLAKVLIGDFCALSSRNYNF
jgi:hypothetical protein